MKKICSTAQNKKVMYAKRRWGNFYPLRQLAPTRGGLSPNSIQKQQCTT